MPMPRALLFVAAIWLIASWLRTIGLSPPVQPSSASYEPGVRMMLMMVAIGWTVLWPLLRLSQSPSIWPLRQTLLDMLVLACLLQVVLWPIRLLTRWTPERTAAIDLVLLSWLAIAGAVVAVTVGARGAGPRLLGMAACLVPVVLLSLPGSRGTGPITAPAALADQGGAPMLPGEWKMPLILALAAALAWIAAGVMAAYRRTPLQPAISRKDDQADVDSPDTGSTVTPCTRGLRKEET